MLEKNNSLYYDNNHYIVVLKGILADVQNKQHNKVTDITDIGAKDTFSTIGRCAKKYEKGRKYFQSYQLCPFDIRVKLLLTRTFTDYTNMFNGCFYTCETANKGLRGLNLFELEERILFLIKLAEVGKLEEMYERQLYDRGYKDKRLNRKLRDVHGGRIIKC